MNKTQFKIMIATSSDVVEGDSTKEKTKRENGKGSPQMVNAVIMLMVIFGIFLTSCNTKEKDGLLSSASAIESFRNTSIPKDMGGLKYGGLTLPDGTTSNLSQNNSKLSMKLPKGVVFAALVHDEVISSEEGGYTCTSDCSGGCDVVKLGGEIGCSACPKESPQVCTGQHDTGADSFPFGRGGGFIDLRQGISFVETINPDDQLDGPSWDVLLKHPDVEKNFERFFQSLWLEDSPKAQNSKLAVVNVYGTFIRMYVPKNMEENSRIANAILSGERVTCKCSSDESGCVYQEITTSGWPKIKIGDRCVAGSCKSCTMLEE